MKDSFFALSRLSAGQSAVIHAIRLESLTRQRLQELGLVPGTRIECLLRAPSGDPTAYRFRSTVVALRRADTCRITVRRDGV